MCHLESKSLDLVRIQPKSIMNHIVTSRADSALVYELWDYEEVIPVGKQIWLEYSNVISDGRFQFLMPPILCERIGIENWLWNIDSSIQIP